MFLKLESYAFVLDLSGQNFNVITELLFWEIYGIYFLQK